MVVPAHVAGLGAVGKLLERRLIDARHRAFDFEILKTEHFDFYHYPEEVEAARLASRLARSHRLHALSGGRALHEALRLRPI